MTLRCHACDKPLLRYAVSNKGADGVEYGFGPKCAKPFLIKKRRSKAIERKTRIGTRTCGDVSQIDWVQQLSEVEHVNYA